MNALSYSLLDAVSIFFLTNVHARRMEKREGAKSFHLLEDGRELIGNRQQSNRGNDIFLPKHVYHFYWKKQCIESISRLVKHGLSVIFSLHKDGNFKPSEVSESYFIDLNKLFIGNETFILMYRCILKT